MPLDAKKQKILVFVDWFLPGYKAGGPIRSIANIIKQLQQDFYFSIVTTDTDAGEKTPYPHIKSNQWIQKDSYRIYYFSKNKLSINEIKEIILADDSDFLYLNSVFSIYFSLVPLILCQHLKPQMQIILAPRGMLGDNALKIKAFKKKLFLYVFSKLPYFKNIIWHASTEQEKNEIIKNFGSLAKVRIAANLPNPINKHFHPREKSENHLKLIFFSRISPKKNLHFALNLLKKWQTKGEIIFDIIGPVEEEIYWQQCLKIISKLPKNIKVNYLGAVDNQLIDQAIANYHFLFFPTLHENFGHVIFEALSSSLPVIISNKTYWSEMEAKGAGWDLCLENEELWLTTLEKCLKMDKTEYQRLSGTAFSLAEKFSNDSKLIAVNKKLFELEQKP